MLSSASLLPPLLTNLVYLVSPFHLSQVLRDALSALKRTCTLGGVPFETVHTPVLDPRSITMVQQLYGSLIPSLTSGEWFIGNDITVMLWCHIWCFFFPSNCYVQEATAPLFLPSLPPSLHPSLPHPSLPPFLPPSLSPSRTDGILAALIHMGASIETPDKKGTHYGMRA